MVYVDICDVLGDHLHQGKFGSCPRYPSSSSKSVLWLGEMISL